MPLIQEINPAEGISAGIWQITESADELLAGIRLSAPEQRSYASFRHDLRRRQWLAYCFLLKHLLAPAEAGISYDRNGKPNLVSGSHHISVSHAGEYAAAIISRHLRVGIDIEKIRDRVQRVKDRFLSESELESLAPDHRIEQLCVYWCGKEALYKLHGTPDVDFRNDIHIHPFNYLCNTNQHCRATLRIGGRSKDYTLYFSKIEDCMFVIAC